MVTNVTNYGRSGLHDWVLQRLSAVVLALYTLCVASFFYHHPDTQYADLQAYFGLTGMKIFSLLALLSVVAHAWIGLWTVYTDYIKCTCIRFVLQIGTSLVLFVYLVAGVMILWGL